MVYKISFDILFYIACITTFFTSCSHEINGPGGKLNRIDFGNYYKMRISSFITFGDSTINLGPWEQISIVKRASQNCMSETLYVKDQIDTVVSNSIYVQNDSGLFLVNDTFNIRPSLYKSLILIPQNRTIIPILLFFLSKDNVYTYDTINGEKLTKTYLGKEKVSVPFGELECHVLKTNGHPNETRYHYYNDLGIIKKVEILDSIPRMQTDSIGNLVVSGYMQSKIIYELIERR